MNKQGIIYLLGFGGFVMGTAEIIIAGILEMIARDTGVSIGATGQLVTVYAVVFAIGSPLLISATSRMERKKLLLLSLAVFIAGSLTAYFSPNFAVLMISRIVLAASAGVYTVVALTAGSNLAAAEKRGNAIGIIIMGFSTALVVGVPLGTLIGESWGWRSVFMLIAVLAALAAAGIWLLFPHIEGKVAVSFKDQLASLKDKRIASALLITFFWILGYQFVFTYIAPLLQHAAGLDAGKISVSLLICGIFAVIGTRIGGYFADKWGIRRTLLFGLILHAAALFALPWMAATFIGALFILAVWIGAAWTTTPAQQYYLVSLSPNASDLALGLNNSVLQLGVAAGAAAGGWVVNQTSIMNLGWIGAISVVISLLAVLYSFSLKSAPHYTKSSN